jgi:hypothetical protein
LRVGVGFWRENGAASVAFGAKVKKNASGGIAEK